MFGVTPEEWRRLGHVIGLPAAAVLALTLMYGLTGHENWATGIAGLFGALTILSLIVGAVQWMMNKRPIIYIALILLMISAAIGGGIGLAIITLV